jgi:hypothetical protein
VLFRDALVVVEQIFRNFRCDAFAIGLNDHQILFGRSLF